MTLNTGVIVGLLILIAIAPPFIVYALILKLVDLVYGDADDKFDSEE